MKHFKLYTKEDIISLTMLRKLETKLGERITTLASDIEMGEALAQSKATYVLLGIPEDIGVNASYGVGGADTNWLPFLTSFLNLQSNDLMSGENVLLLGHFDFGDIKYLIERNAKGTEEMVDAYRHAVKLIDEEVEKVIKTIVSCKKIPIIIGGGHNNAYPIIKGAAKGLQSAGLIPLSQVNVINLDAQADYKPVNGRHCENAFRYAETDGFLGKYSVIGIHESYIPQHVLVDLDESPFVQYITYEDIFLYEKKNFFQAIATAIGFTEDTFTGIELDLDCIEDILSGSSSPSGITVLQARQYISYTSIDTKAAYLHICGGATHLADGRKDESAGKLISYLVSDFIKGSMRI